VIHKFLDAREMSHPEPLEKAIAILRQLDNDSCLYMLSRKNPTPLLKIAEENRLQTITQEVVPNEWHILITPNDNIDLKAELRV
jgi:hypothetical protein